MPILIIALVALAALLVYLSLNYFKLNKKYKEASGTLEQIRGSAARIAQLTAERIKLEAELKDERERTQAELSVLHAELEKEHRALDESKEKRLAQEATHKKKLQKLKELYQAILYSIEHTEPLPRDSAELYDEMCPTVTLHLHAMEMKDLRAEFRTTDRHIQSVVEQYEGRYTTKTIAALYKLMTIAMRAELQNILYSLKYEKLDTAIDSVKALSSKYYAIATEGNQTIANTMREYISKIEYLFIDEVKIEYNYYVKKEQAKAEQEARREQMRIEAAEHKALEEMRKKVEQEEAKYRAEIARLASFAESAETAEEKERHEARAAEIQAQLVEVEANKEKIAKLQNGKAGTVYVISNLGSFGENMFKIGMTRRLVPEDRVKELGDASVPFHFDIHSTIFSEDAPALEHKIHTILHQKRVNKVNLRKEFFNTTVEELEALVQEIDPTASFTKTMAAEEYRQSLSTDEVYSTDYVVDDTDDE